LAVNVAQAAKVMTRYGLCISYDQECNFYGVLCRFYL